MAIVYDYADNVRQPRQRRRIDWQVRLTSALAAICLLLAVALMYRSHQTLAALVPAPAVAQAQAADTPTVQPSAQGHHSVRPYSPADDVWQWLEPLPPQF